jgi:hypothetical protein
LTTQPGLSFFELPAPSADRRVRRFLARGLDDAPDAGPGRAGDDASIRAQKTILPRTGVKWLIMTGSALAVIGQVLLTRLSPHGNYAGEIVPSLILTGLGVGCLFCSAIFGGTVSVRPGDAGIAGALVNTSLQIGGSVGTTVLSLVFASSVAGYEASHAASRSLAQDAPIHGYAAAFWWQPGFPPSGSSSRPSSSRNAPQPP